MKGRINKELMPPLLDALPLELTLIDANDTIVAWSEPDEEIFHREETILGTDVRECHPEKSQERVEGLLKDLKSGNKDKERIMLDCKGPDGSPAKVGIEYIALRSAEGEYLGCLEACWYVKRMD
jgi:DUF438 domain-containing protein